MKIYTILITASITLTILLIATPQLTSTIFVNNKKERIPTDWLSALILKFEKPIKKQSYSIPTSTKFIKIIGNNNYLFGYSTMNISTNNQYPKISSYELDHTQFTMNKDTLLVKIKEGHINPSLALELSSNIKNIVLKSIGIVKLIPTEKLSLDLTIENKSDIILSGERKSSLKNITVKDKSTLTLTHCIVASFDMKIYNSMVYVDPLNAIDSLHASLIGKSNIKKQKQPRNYVDNNFESLQNEKQQMYVNIYPTGNLNYYKLNK